MIINDYGYKGNQTDIARIIAVHKSRYQVMSNNGSQSAQLKNSAYYGTSAKLFPVVGDFVKILGTSNETVQILDTLPRETYLQRFDSFSHGRNVQPMAANFDYVFIMTSLNEDFNLNRIQRYLTVAYQSNAKPVVLLTKADLITNSDEFVAKTKLLGNNLECYAISTKQNMGLDAVKSLMTRGTTSIFLGSSGVGKSTLVNTLANKEIMTTNGIREEDGKGRHTTTYRQLLMLEGGEMIIDTPGMRELGIVAAKNGISAVYSDIEEMGEQCKFSDCTHTVEKGCAVLEAVKRGEISESRYNSYIRLRKEANRKTNLKVEIAKKKKKL